MQNTNSRLEKARADILKESPSANIETVVLDFDSLAAVRNAASAITAKGNVDVLVNNGARTFLQPDTDL